MSATVLSSPSLGEGGSRNDPGAMNDDREDNEMPDPVIDASEPISAWFGLSYAQFLTVPRIFMERMPVEWQRRMTECLRELDDAFEWTPNEGTYWVSLRGDDGRYLALDSNVCDYQRGDVEHLRHPAAPELAGEGGSGT